MTHLCYTEPTDRPLEDADDEPVSLATAKSSLKVTSTLEEDLISGWIQTARMLFEEESGRQILTRRWEYTMDRVPCRRVLELPRPPLYGSVSILYNDADGDEQTFSADNYIVHGSFISGYVDPHCRPGRIELVDGASWPTVQSGVGTFRVRRTCGYTDDESELPFIIKAALLTLVGHFHRNRSEAQTSAAFQSLPIGAKSIIQTFKWTALPSLPPDPSLITTGRIY